MHDDDELTRFRAEIARLQEENHDLRRASESFGHLAERLNRELQGERRLRAAERSDAQRASDRRIGLLNWPDVEVA